MEVLSDYGASARIRLNEVCAVLGLPGKFGVSGADVAGMVDKGELQAVRDYCETDVLNTYLVYLRMMLHRGTLSLDDHNRAVADVVSLIEAEGEARPHLRAFLEAWGEASNNNSFFERKRLGGAYSGSGSPGSSLSTVAPRFVTVSMRASGKVSRTA